MRCRTPGPPITFSRVPQWPRLRRVPPPASESVLRVCAPPSFPLGQRYSVWPSQGCSVAAAAQTFRQPIFPCLLKLRTSRFGDQRTRRGEHGSTASGGLPGAGGGVSGLGAEGQGLGRRPMGWSWVRWAAGARTPGAGKRGLTAPPLNHRQRPGRAVSWQPAWHRAARRVRCASS